MCSVMHLRDAFTSHIAYSVFSSREEKILLPGRKEDLGSVRDLGVDPESGEMATRAGSRRLGN